MSSRNLVVTLPTVRSSSTYGRCDSRCSRNFSIQNAWSPNRFAFGVTPLVNVCHCISYEYATLFQSGKSTAAAQDAAGTMVRRCGGRSRAVIHWSNPA